MKLISFLLISTLLISSTYQYTNNVLEICVQKTMDPCAECVADMNKKCMTAGTTPYDSSQCTYVRENSAEYASNPDKRWSDEFGEEWHGCMKKCEKETSGSTKSYVEGYTSCGSSVI